MGPGFLIGLLLFVGPRFVSAQASTVFERREAIFDAARDLDRCPEADSACFDLVSELREALSDEDERVRTFAARALERWARDPSNEEITSWVRAGFEERVDCEDSIFVRYWLERGLGSPRPTLEQRLAHAASEPELIRRVPRNAGSVSWEVRWANWLEACPGSEPDWRALRQRRGAEGIANHTRLSKQSLEACATLLVLHGDELTIAWHSGDALAHEVLLRIDDHLRTRLEWMTDLIEERAEQRDMGLWVALGRAYGFESHEQIVKPNFHHLNPFGAQICIVVREQILAAVIDGLLHGDARERGQLMRLLRELGDVSGLAAPFVIHSWGGGEASVQSAWLGVRENLYDAISAGGFETLALVEESTKDGSSLRRAHACRALPRFGGRAAVCADALLSAQSDPDVEVRREAFIAYRQLVPRTVDERRAETLRIAEALKKALAGEKSLQRDLGLKLEAALSDADSAVRAYAAFGLNALAVLPGGGYRATLRLHLKRAAQHEKDPAVNYWMRHGYGGFRLDFIKRRKDRRFLELHLPELTRVLMETEDAEERRAAVLILMKHEGGLALGRPFIEWAFSDLAGDPQN